MNLPPDVVKILHNKAAVAGVGGVAALGLYVAHKNKTSTGSTASSSSAAPSSTTAAGQTSSGGVADGSAGPTTYPNTYGTDLATALGNIDSQYAGQVQQFNSQLGTTDAALTALQTQVSGLNQKAPGGGSTGAPVTAPASNSKTSTITVQKGETQAQVIKKAGINYATLLKLNPGVKLQGGKIKAGQKLNV